MTIQSVIFQNEPDVQICGHMKFITLTLRPMPFGRCKKLIISIEEEVDYECWVFIIIYANYQSRRIVGSIFLKCFIRVVLSRFVESHAILIFLSFLQMPLRIFMIYGAI